MTTMPITAQERIPMPVDVAARPAGAGPGMTVGDAVRVLKRHIFLILFIWIVVTGLAAGLTAYLVKNHPRYRASSFVFVESPFPKTPMQFGEHLVQVDLMDRFVANQRELLKDEEVLRNTLEDAGVRATQWFQEHEDEYEALEELRGDLSVAQVKDTSYLVVSFSTENAANSAEIVNTAVTKYLAKVETMSRDRYSTELQDYEKRERDLKTELQRIRDDKQEFIEANLGSPGVAEGLNVVGETWRALAAEVTRLETEKLQYKSAYENLRRVDPSQIAISPQMRLMIQQDPKVLSMQTEQFQLTNLLLIFEQQGLGENHREVQDIRSRLAVNEQQLIGVLADKEDEFRDYQLYSAETAYLNAVQAELELRERMLLAEAKQRDLDRGLAHYRNLEEEQLLLEDQLTRLRDYIGQLQLVIKDRGMVRVRRIGQAYPPRKRHFPRWELNLPGGSFLGLLLGTGLAFLLELASTSIKTSRDIVRHVHVPILGTVPDLDDEEVPIDKMELAAHTAPRSMVAEAFRAIRTNLLLSSPAERQRSVLITSSKPEEGKTSVAANLAISIAQSGRRVLLVDANFHRPTLHQLFPQARPEGLSNVLIGQDKVDRLVTSTDLPNLDVLTSGPTPPNPAELLVSPYWREMITDATQRYDQIIFDGPPVLLVSDVLVMAGGVDGVILVCRARGCSRGTVLRAREQLERVNGHLFGAVLNAAQVTRGGYFREQMRSYYDYQPEEALAAEPAPALPRDSEDQDSPKA